MTVVDADDKWVEAQLAFVLASIIDSTLLEYLLCLPCYVGCGVRLQYVYKSGLR